ncbi:flagellar assembly protein FliH [Ammoniphilus oxalaticus]|uniref:Flagellar assembly protein FliH n=1 Tax=Ammoniphilus oxalaticus TaxID=66863 RepID=A0A419SJT8_9BACL|nr:flagellar assembly protein FliH [Ammoniphilus oxalaticus]RKD24199.1 flagellar assembly protein FliH [Ammoniphilus oxalaticus]
MSSVYKQVLLERSRLEVKVLQIPTYLDTSPCLDNDRLATSESYQLQKAEEAAQKIISDAEEMAEQLIEQTKQEIATLQEQAEQQQFERWQQLESDSEQALEQARTEGYQAGFESGQLEGEQTAMREYETLLQEAQEVLMEAGQEKQRTLGEAETFLVRLSTEIAHKIVMETIEIQPDLVLGLVKETLRRVKERESVSIHVHPSDYSLLQAERKQILSWVDEQVEVKVCPDKSVGRGGCIIRTSEGSVDATIDTQLNEIKNCLMSLVKEQQDE